MYMSDGVSFSKIYFCLSNAIAPLFLNQFLKVRCDLESPEEILHIGNGLIFMAFVVEKSSIFDEI